MLCILRWLENACGLVIGSGLDDRVSCCVARAAGPGLITVRSSSSRCVSLYVPAGIFGALSYDIGGCCIDGLHGEPSPVGWCSREAGQVMELREERLSKVNAEQIAKTEGEKTQVFGDTQTTSDRLNFA